MRCPFFRSGFAAILPLLAVTAATQAHLGGFESADGYQSFLNMVQNYNAGQYGVNSGYIAMAPVAITPSTGLWHNINGGFFSGGGVSYATGHQNYDRTYWNSGGAMGSSSDQALVLTTGHEGVGGPALKYKYDVDASDLLGVNPTATGSAVVRASFWVRGYLDPGLVGPGYFGDEITFEDSAGNVGFNLGLTKTSTGDMVTFWDGTGMQITGINGATGVYDRWDISLDIANDTVSASYYQFATNTSYNLINNVTMANAMSDFTHMTFRTTPGTNNAKYNSVDDFAFSTNLPTPGAATILGMSALAAVSRRRR
jgi:hypothetical protein